MSASQTLVVTTKSELRAARAALRGTVALVMTMGALHEGHLMLVRHARSIADHVILSDFVNPLQFGPHEDFEAYPRDLEKDVQMVEGMVDIVFAPSVEEMYPVLPPLISVTTNAAGTRYEGEVRPGHFDGVATVVTKVLLLSQPDVAVFGRKDAQQLAIVNRLVEDLDIPVRIEPVDIQRDPTGLALSSRNVYLSAEGREQALALSRLIRAVQEAAPSTSAVLKVLQQAREDAPIIWDYLLAIDPTTFDEVDESFRGELLVMIAGRVEGTHLLDAAVVTVTQE